MLEPSAVLPRRPSVVTSPRGAHQRTLRILRIADVPDNRHGGMSRVMYCTGDVLQEQGHTVEYVFSQDLVSAAPQRLRRFCIPWLIPGLVARRQCQRAPY